MKKAMLIMFGIATIFRTTDSFAENCVWMAGFYGGGAFETPIIDSIAYDQYCYDDKGNLIRDDKGYSQVRGFNFSADPNVVGLPITFGEFSTSAGISSEFYDDLLEGDNESIYDQSVQPYFMNYYTATINSNGVWELTSSTDYYVDTENGGINVYTYSNGDWILDGHISEEEFLAFFNTLKLSESLNEGNSEEISIETPTGPTPTPTEPQKPKRTYYTPAEAAAHVNHSNHNKIIFTFK